MTLKEALVNSGFDAELIDNPNVAFIAVSKNKCCVIDIWNWSWLNNLCTWRLDKDNYAIGHVNQKDIKMHRLIANKIKLNLLNEIDHINGITIDNRGSNLRSATKNQNMHNMKRPITNTSGYKNISWSDYFNKWNVQIWKGNKKVFCRYYVTLDKAIEARNNALKKLHGEFARLE